MPFTRSETPTGWTLLGLQGDLDAPAAPEVEAACREALRPGVRLALDLRELRFLSSAGLRIFLAVAKELGPLQGRMALVAPSARVRDVLEVSGFDRFLPVVNGLEDLA